MVWHLSNFHSKVVSTEDFSILGKNGQFSRVNICGTTHFFEKKNLTSHLYPDTDQYIKKWKNLKRVTKEIV